MVEAQVLPSPLAFPRDMESINPSTILLESHAPGLVGVFFSAFLYGIQLVQTFTYYDSYPNDALWLKISVGILLLADLLHAVFGCGWIFRLMILDFADLEAWFFAGWLLRTDPALGGIIACACQLFFAWRIYILTKNYYITVFVALLGIAVLVGGVGIGIKLTFTSDLRQRGEIKSWVILWLLPGMIADIAITITMTYFLRRRSTGFHNTNNIINRILRLTVQNCLLTSLCGTASLASFLATPKGYHIGFTYLVPKLYSNSVLSSLNSRTRLKNVASDWENQVSTTSTHRSGEVVSQGNRSRTWNGRQEIYNLTTAQPQVYIDVETGPKSKTNGL